MRSSDYVVGNGNLGRYKQINLARCVLLMVCSHTIAKRSSGLGWVAEGGIWGNGRDYQRSWPTSREQWLVASIKEVTVEQIGGEEGMDWGHQMCYDVQLLGCTKEEWGAKDSLGIKWTKELPVEISSGEKG